VSEPPACSCPVSSLHNLKTHHAIVTIHSLITAHLRLGLQGEPCWVSDVNSHIFLPFPMRATYTIHLVFISLVTQILNVEYNNLRETLFSHTWPCSDIEVSLIYCTKCSTPGKYDMTFERIKSDLCLSDRPNYHNDGVDTYARAQACIFFFCSIVRRNLEDKMGEKRNPELTRQ
jgi:hypothetical protein